MCKIFIFTWNTQSVRYGVDGNPSADFINELSKKITNSKCDLAAIGLQEDAIRDSTLIEELINTINFQVVKIVTMSGWGVTTFKALKDDWEYRPRGLRLLVLRHPDCKLEITSVDSQEIVCPSIRDWLTNGKGGVTINVRTSIGDISFLNLHLPFNSYSILPDAERHDSVMWQAKCLRELYNTVMDLYNPKYIFVFGDLNFRVQLRTETGAKHVAEKLLTDSNYLEELVDEADELRLLLEYSKTQDVLPLLDEGIDNVGPRFFPTCKLEQGRSKPFSFRFGGSNQRVPSWCDRILSNGDIVCTSYNRWDYGKMNCSDHAAVIGEYQFNY